MNVREFVPSYGNALLLKNNINNRLYDSLAYLITIVKDVIKVEHSSLNNALARIKQSSHLSGYLHAIHYHLIKAIEIKNIDQINEIINAMCNDKCDNNGVFIFNFSQYDLGINKFNTLKNTIDKDDKYEIKLKEVNQKDFQLAKDNLNNALELIKDTDLPLYQEIVELVNEIIVVKNDTNNFMYSGTSFHTYGTIFISVDHDDKSIFKFIESIVHESAHLYLYAIALDDTLVLNSDDERYIAPLRKDKRTMTGIYHAVIVIARILYIFYKIRTTGYINDDQKIDLQNRIHKFEILFDTTMKTISQYGNLTPVAQEILNVAQQMINLEIIQHKLLDI